MISVWAYTVIDLFRSGELIILLNSDLAAAIFYIFSNDFKTFYFQKESEYDSIQWNYLTISEAFMNLIFYYVI